MFMSTIRLTHCLLAIAISTASMQISRADDRQTLQVDGAARSYVVRVPENVKNNARLPLVMVLHGGGGNAANAETMTGFTEKARTENFIVVYPEGSGRFRRGLLTWNAGHCCGHAMTERVDDVKFINLLIDHLVNEYPIDDKRIYVTGMSNGGMMTHRLGIELSNRIAAIAPVVGTVFGDERKSAHPVPALMINGLLDRSVPNAGGAPGGRFTDAWDGVPAKPALDQGTFWASSNGCEATPTKFETATHSRWQYKCPVGRDVELIVLKDNGHAWPGGQQGNRRGDKPSAALNATEVIWDFFRSHPMFR
jgi:polyhydroxybutyrate depolymerase